MERPIGTIDQPQSLPIKRIVDENDNVRTFYFSASFHAKPGQFVIMWLPGVDEKPFSVADDANGTLALSIAQVGPFTEKLFEKKVGDYVGLRGPYGSWYTLPNQAKRILLVGGGYGIAPLSFFAREALAKGINVDICSGARTKGLLLYHEELPKIGVTAHTTTDDGSAGKKGTVMVAVEECLTLNQYDSVYTCGPEMMQYHVAKRCADAGVPCQVSVERYMKCGFGICGQCCVDSTGHRMCQEGPVVSAEYALQQEEFGRYHRTKSGKKEEFHGHR